MQTPVPWERGEPGKKRQVAAPCMFHYLFVAVLRALATPAGRKGPFDTTVCYFDTRCYSIGVFGPTRFSSDFDLVISHTCRRSWGNSSNVGRELVRALHRALWLCYFREQRLCCIRCAGAGFQMWADFRGGLHELEEDDVESAEETGATGAEYGFSNFYVYASGPCDTSIGNATPAVRRRMTQTYGLPVSGSLQGLYKAKANRVFSNLLIRSRG